MLATLRERLLLEHAERRASEYSREQAERIRVLSLAAASRAALSRSLTAPRDDASAVALLREAIVLHRRVHRVASGEPDIDPVSLEGLPLRTEDRRAAERVLAMGEDDAELEALARDEIESLREALDRVERVVARRVETRSVEVIRAIRNIHLAGLVIAGLLVVYHVAHTFLTPPNVALNRPVTSSGFSAESALPETLVDGVDESRKPVVSVHAPGAWLAVDLGTSYMVKTVRLVNRQDRAFDDSLPFWIEFTSDGEHWTPIVKRRDHFRTWTYDVSSADGAWVRGVRLRCNATCAIGLNELEVRGRPAH